MRAGYTIVYRENPLAYVVFPCTEKNPLCKNAVFMRLWGKREFFKKNKMKGLTAMKRSTAMILAALVLSTAALSGCSRSCSKADTSAPSDSGTATSPQDSSAAESTESEISDTESNVVSEATSTESSEEISKTSTVESSDNKSKTESSQTKTEEKSKPESSKSETSKTEQSSAPKTENSKVETSKTETSKTETSKPQEIKATGISIDLSTLSLTAGYGYELNAYVLWSNNTQSYNGIVWSSSNPSVASVSSTGYVTAKSGGTATITASYGTFSKSCNVTVKAAQQTQPSTQTSQSSGGSSGSNSGSSGSSSGSNNGGSGGQTSQSSGGNSGNSGSSGGSSGSSGEASKQSGDTGSSENTQIPSGGNVVKGDWGWTQYDEQIGFWVVDSMYKDQWGNEYHAKTLEKDHAKDKLVTRNGQYTCYLCPEIVPAFNAYLKDHGYNYEFKWYCDLEDGHRDMTNYPNKNANSGTQGCIDNYEMECKTQIMSHETEYSCGGAQIIGDMSEGYDFYGLIKSIHEEAPSHWNSLLKAAQKRGTITAIIAPCKPNDLSSGFMVYIN